MRTSWVSCAVTYENVSIRIIHDRVAAGFRACALSIVKRERGQTSIKEEFVVISLNSRHIAHFSKLGYEIPKRRDTFGRFRTPLNTELRIKTSDLPAHSTIIITRVCDGCGKEEKVQYRDAVSRGNGICRSCVISNENLIRFEKRAHKGFSLADLYPDIASEWSEQLNRGVSPTDVLPGSNRKFWWDCSSCGFTWQTSVNHRKRGSGCPLCRESKGEKAIRDWLDSHGISFRAQVTVPGLVGMGGGPLSYDFLVLNAWGESSLFIEYDGEYHFHAIDTGYGVEAAQKRLETQKEHDRLKEEYCQRAGVQLLRIPYMDFVRIPEILSRELDNHLNLGEVA